MVNLFACPLKDARITSVDSRGSEVYTGTSQGVLQRWQVQQEKGEDSEYVSRQLSQLQLKKKPVLQLVLDPEWPLLFTLCDEVVTAHNSANFSKEFQIMEESKKNIMSGCTCISVAPVYKGTHRLCVATKRKLYLYRYKVPLSDRSGVRLGQPSCEMFQKLMMPSTVLSLAFFGETLCCGYLKEYSLLNCYSGKATGLFTLTAQQPYVRLLDTEHAALCSIGSKSIWVSVRDSDLKGNTPTAGRLTRETIRWSSEPKAVAFKHPYIIGLLARSTEVYSVYEHTVIQSLPNISGATLSSTQTPRGADQVCIATDKAVYMLITIPVEDQIRVLVQKLMMTEAFDLLKRNTTGNEQLDGDRLNDTHIAAGFAFMFHAKPVSAFEHFAATDVNLKDILVHFPHLLPPTLLPHAVLEYHNRYGASVPILYNNTSAELIAAYVNGLTEEVPSTAEMGLITLLERYRRMYSGASPAFGPAVSVPSSGQLMPADLQPSSAASGGIAGMTLDTFESSPVSEGAAILSEADDRARSPTPSATTPVLSAAALNGSPGSQVGHAETDSVLSHTVDSLIMFLTARRIDCDEEQKRYVDYVLLYVNVDRDHPEAVFSLLSDDNACDLNDCVHVLEDRALHSELALLYFSKQRYAEAAVAYDRSDLVRKILLHRKVRSSDAASEDVQVVPRTADPEALQKDSEEIFLAVASDKPAYVRAVLRRGVRKGRRVETLQDSQGNTPLHHAVALACVAAYEDAQDEVPGSSLFEGTEGEEGDGAFCAATHSSSAYITTSPVTKRGAKSFGGQDQESIFGVLMTYGADVNAKNRYGLSPHDVARCASLKVWGMLSAIHDLREVCGDTTL